MQPRRVRIITKTVFATLLGIALLGGAMGLAVLFGGWYNIGATKQHFPVIYFVFEEGMRYSVRYHAQGIEAPALGAPQQVARGAAIYRAHCASCHGGPGVAPELHGMSMQPAPGPLSNVGEHWAARELYWITRHGVKMSGMPAWQYHLSDAELWAVVAFVSAMPSMTAQDYRRLTAQDGRPVAAPQPGAES